MVPIIDDNRHELNENFTGVLTLPSGSSGVRLGVATATVTVTDIESENTALISSKQLGGMLAVAKTCSLFVIACKHYIWQTDFVTGVVVGFEQLRYSENEDVGVFSVCVVVIVPRDTEPLDRTFSLSVNTRPGTVGMYAFQPSGYQTVYAPGN